MSTPPDDPDAQPFAKAAKTATDEFSKEVEYAAKDDEEQVAYGAAFIPNELDLQGDFIRAAPLMEAAAGFGGRVGDGDAHLGVMHAVFPGEEHVDLAEERILQQSETLGGETFPAGTWVQAHKYNDDELWGLVSDGIIEGFSIGGTIEGEVWYSPGEAPDDIRVPDAVADYLDEHGASVEEIDVREIKDIRLLETSSVDTPAVPRALHREHKSAGVNTKSHPALTDNVVAARNYLERRGHTEDEALRLAEYLDRAKAASDGRVLAAAKRFLRAVRLSDGSVELADETTPAEPGRGADELESEPKSEPFHMDDEVSDKFDELEAQIEANKESNEEQTKTLKSIEDALSGGEGENDEEKTVGEMTEAELKSYIGDAVSDATSEKTDGDDLTVEDLQSDVKTVSDAQDELDAKLERLLEAKGVSQQDTDPNEEKTADEDSLDGLATLMG